MIKALMAEKLGMTQIFVEDRAVPVTVLRAGPCRISQVKTPEKDGYAAVQLAFGEMKPSHVTDPQAGHFAKAGVAASRHVAEVRLDDVADVEAGQTITVGEIFEAGMVADVTGITKGKGFSGVMKRHNFSGQLASHGVHRVHRAAGSIGAASTPARVFKGMPMAGRLGNERQTILNLEVVAVDLEDDLIMLKGSVPGRSGSVVMLRHAVKAGEQDLPTPPEPEVVEEPEEDTPTEEVESSDAVEEASTDEDPASDESDTEEASDG